GPSLPMCEARGRPGNSVVVHYTHADPIDDQGKPMSITGVVASAGTGIPTVIDVAEFGSSSGKTQWMLIEAAPDQTWTIAARNVPPFAVRTGSLVTAS